MAHPDRRGSERELARPRAPVEDRRIQCARCGGRRAGGRALRVLASPLYLYGSAAPRAERIGGRETDPWARGRTRGQNHRGHGLRIRFAAGGGPRGGVRWVLAEAVS